jgi:hypothetical protein
MAKLGDLHLVIDKKRNMGFLENLQLRECQLLENFIVTGCDHSIMSHF